MLRLRGVVAATAAPSLLLRGAQASRQAPVAARLCCAVWSGASSSAAMHGASTSVTAATCIAQRHFGQAPVAARFKRLDACYPAAHVPSTATAPAAAAAPFWRGVRLAAAAPTTLSAQVMQCRWFRVKGRDDGSASAEKEGEKASEGEREEASAKSERTDELADKSKAEGEQDTTAKNAKRGKGKTAKKKSFMDHVRGLREDYANFPHIYNSANAINFVVFTVFCLCSTGSNTEERWWMEQWGVDNSVRPWTWLLHSFLTNNLLSVTYAMMLLHTMCHQMLPTLGSRGLMLYCGSTAVISGAVMWLGNWLYYGSGAAAPEKQFGPWDIVAALFVMEYFYYGLTPMTILNSFSGWIKYACWVGEVCILYFDWQPTLVGTLVGLALCKGVPRFKAVKPAAAA